jgi:hypothetical protein
MGGGLALDAMSRPDLESFSAKVQPEGPHSTRERVGTRVLFYGLSASVKAICLSAILLFVTLSCA